MELPPNVVVDLVTAESGDVVSYNAFYPPVEVNSVETPVIFYSPETVGGAGPQGSLGPPGPTGPTGSSAFTTTAGAFDLPALGASVTVTLQDASWVTVGQMVVVQTAGGSPTDAYSLKVTAKTGNLVTLLNIGTSATGFAGDMLKSVYDVNNDGFVDKAAALATPGSAHQFWKNGNLWGAVDISDLTGVPASFTPSAHASSHFSGGSDPLPPLDIQVFTATGAGTWTKPTLGSPRLVRVICIGGGGGGSSGEYRASGTACGGGAGGAGGYLATVDIPASVIAGSTVSLNVGAGGAGGAASTAAGVGKVGTAGGVSWFGGAANQAYLAASGGQPGAANVAGTGAVAGNNGTFTPAYGSGGADGAAGGTAGAVGANATVQNNRLGGGSGGGGAGLAATPAALSGGTGSPNSTGYGGGNPGNTTTYPGGNGAGNAFNAYAPGDGGGGGASSLTAGKIGNGGTGGLYGGGGGGGGASTTAVVSSGAGGNGGNGCVIVFTFFS